MFGSITLIPDVALILKAQITSSYYLHSFTIAWNKTISNWVCQLSQFMHQNDLWTCSWAFAVGEIDPKTRSDYKMFEQIRENRWLIDKVRTWIQKLTSNDKEKKKRTVMPCQRMEKTRLKVLYKNKNSFKSVSWQGRF